MLNLRLQLLLKLKDPFYRSNSNETGTPGTGEDQEQMDTEVEDYKYSGCPYNAVINGEKCFRLGSAHAVWR